jgi:hypothetical protein
MDSAMTLAAAAKGTKQQHLAVLLLIPLIMAAINSNWLYSPIGYLDPWYNVGYFLHYGDATFRMAHYKISRLSWLLPGWLMYHLFVPLVANFVLHVGALLVATVFVYLTLARLVERDVAFLTAVFLTIYYPFHGSGGWDYQNTGAGAFYALTLYCLTRAGQSKTPAAGLFAAGMAFAATVHASILFANIVPVLVLQYVLVRRVVQRPLCLRLMGHALAAVSAGFLALTLLLCLINWSIGREFLFFWPILEIVFHFVEDPSQQKNWWTSWSSGWALQRAAVNYLAVPCATMLVGVVVLLRTPRRAWSDSGNQLSLFLIAQYVLLGAVWTVWQSIGQTALQPGYFAYPLIIPCVLGLAGIMAIGERTARASTTRWLAPACLLLALLPGVDLLPRIVSGKTLAAVIQTNGVPLFLLGALLLVAVLTLARARPFLAFAAILIFHVYATSYAFIGRAYSAADRCGLNSTAFSGLIALDQFVSESGDRERTWIWVGPQEIAFGAGGCQFNLGYFRQSAAMLALNWLGNPTDTTTSQITDQQIAPIGVGDWLAVVTTDPSHAAELTERLRQLGRSVGPLHQREITVAHARLFLQLLPITRSTSAE